mgnify:CR=1 FL=1
MHILLMSLQQMVSFATGVMYQASSDAVHNPAAACSRASAFSSHTGQRNAQQQQQQQQEPQLVQQLILSTQWCNVSGFLLAAQCYAKLISLQHPIPGATVGSSSSGSGSGGDSGSGGCSSSSSSVLYPDRVLTYTRSVSLASDWQHGLPASHQQLLKLLGCSSKGVLWAAGMLVEHTERDACMTMTVAAHSIASLWVLSHAQQRAGKHMGSEVYAASGLAVAATDLLLASVLLHCAAHCPSQPREEAYIRVCALAATFANDAWTVFGSIWKCLATEAPAVHSEQQQAIVAELEQLAAAAAAAAAAAGHCG